MKKIKTSNKYPFLSLKTGIVVFLSKSGLLHASFFDSDNDYNSLLESLICISKYLDCDIDKVKNDCVLLYEELIEYTKNHNCGSIVITENDQT